MYNLFLSVRLWEGKSSSIGIKIGILQTKSKILPAGPSPAAARSRPNKIDRRERLQLAALATYATLVDEK